MNEKDTILKDVIPAGAEGFLLHHTILPAPAMPLFLRRHAFMNTDLPNTHQMGTDAQRFRCIQIAPHPAGFEPQVVTLPPDSNGVSRAALLKRAYRSRLGVREMERENEQRRKKAKKSNCSKLRTML